MPSPSQPPSHWASNCVAICDALGILAVRLAWAVVLVSAAHLDVIAAWLSLLP